MEVPNSGPCLMCGLPTEYTWSEKQRQRRSAEWLERISRKWKTPATFTVRGKNVFVNGCSGSSLRPVMCLRCWHCYRINRKAIKADGLKKKHVNAKQRKTFRDMPYAEYLQTNYWKQVRREVLKERGYKCELCGSVHELNIHHKNYNHRGDELKHTADLVVLCRTCHADRHNIIYPPKCC